MPMTAIRIQELAFRHASSNQRPDEQTGARPLVKLDYARQLLSSCWSQREETPRLWRRVGAAKRSDLERCSRGWSISEATMSQRSLRPDVRYGQSPLAAWHFAMPRPEHSQMTKAQRDAWLELIMGCSFHPAAGPKVDRVAYGAGLEPEDEPLEIEQERERD